MVSDNPVYKPYEIRASEIIEVWEYACGLMLEEYQPEDLNYESIRDMQRQLRVDILELKESIAPKKT
jgi:hypothetical protein